jgi:hypothetical protein
MQQGLQEEALQDFNLAAAQDPENSEVPLTENSVFSRSELGSH